MIIRLVLLSVKQKKFWEKDFDVIIESGDVCKKHLRHYYKVLNGKKIVCS